MDEEIKALNNTVKDLKILVRHMDLCLDRADVYRSLLEKGEDAERLMKLLDLRIHND